LTREDEATTFSLLEAAPDGKRTSLLGANEAREPRTMKKEKASTRPKADKAPSDRELIERIRSQDWNAFEVLVLRYQDRVYGLALGMLRDDDEAQDVVQETFLNVFRKLESFRGESAFSSWLYRIAANNAMMKLRGKRRRVETSLEEVLPAYNTDGHFTVSIEDWSQRVDKMLEDRELGEHIRQAVDKLPDIYRAVFLLSDIHDMSMRDIAATLDLTVPNVKTRLHRARLYLRAELDRYVKS